MVLSESLRKQVSDLVATNRVVLFMKGTRQMPQCGFSAQVVQILDELPPVTKPLTCFDHPSSGTGSRNSPSGRRFLNFTSADSSLVAAISCVI